MHAICLASLKILCFVFKCKKCTREKTKNVDAAENAKAKTDADTKRNCNKRLKLFCMHCAVMCAVWCM